MIKVLRYEIGPMPTNAYIGYDEETKAGFLIDPAVYVKAITDKINELEIDLQYIILTHGHFDHIEGVEDFKKDFPQAKVVCHGEEREMLRSGELNSSLDFRGVPYTTEADVTVRHRESMKIGNSELTFFHTPGHTKGGISVYTPGNPGYCFSGDTLFRRSIGRTDFHGGDFRTLMNSIKDVLFYLPDETVVLPGHMDPTTIGEEKRGNPFV